MSKDEAAYIAKGMTAHSKGWWRVSLRADGRLAPVAEAALEPFAQSVSRFEEKAGADSRCGAWRVQALFAEKPDVADLAAVLDEAAERAGVAPPDFDVEEVGDVDWLALNRRQFPPVRVGRFFVHGSHFEGAPPAGTIALRVNAGPAFGSGTHETTRGCLMAIDGCIGGRRIARALDLGCGSGLLALAVAAATGAEVLASDIDEAAVAAARANARANGLSGRVRAIREDGVVDRVRAQAPFDLVVANILAGPLMAMAADLSEVVAPGALLILSGILAREEREVIAVYRGAGFERLRSTVLGEWATLVLSPEGGP